MNPSAHDENMAKPISSQRLQYFVRVADCESLTAAARSLHITQPSLSAALRKLEAQLGVTLFQRLGRGLELTDEGSALLAHARDVVERLEQLTEAAATISGDGCGTVTLAAPSGAASSIVGPLVCEFARRYPQGRVHLVRTDDLAETLASVRHAVADVGLLPRLMVPDDLEGHDVGSDELVLAIPPGLRLPAGPVDVSSLDRVRFISGRPGAGPDRLLQEARRRGARPRVVMVEPDVAALPRLVAHGVGAAVVPVQLAPELHALGVPCRRFAPRERWPVRLIHRRSGLTAIVRGFVACALEAAGEG